MVVVNSFDGKGGGVPAQESEAAGENAAKGVSTTGDSFEGGGGEDGREKQAVPPALNLLDRLLRHYAADSGGGAVHYCECGARAS